MVRTGVPSELEHLTVWERWEQDFRNADMTDNVQRLSALWRQAYFLAFQQRREIPRELRPSEWIIGRVNQGKGVYTNKIGAWFAAMSKWSREHWTTRYRR